VSELITRIASDLLIPVSYASVVARSAPHRYKVYQIPKKTGGTRTIAQPAREVKRLQYWVLDNLLCQCAVHETAMAYEAGSSILRNAAAHTQGRYLLKMDFRNFFSSIREDDFLLYMKQMAPELVDEEERDIVSHVLFWQPKKLKGLRLSVGAPSSPRVSNILMFDFDSQIAALCEDWGVSYTRYADDLAFSMDDKDARAEIERAVGETLRNIAWPGNLKVNRKKTYFGSRASRRRVTGLILTNDDRVSLGRQRKRLLRAQIHRFYVLEKQDRLDEQTLAGLVAFARSIEPDFVKRLERKFEIELPGGSENE